MALYFCQFFSAFIGHQPAGSGQLQPIKTKGKLANSGVPCFHIIDILVTGVYYSSPKQFTRHCSEGNKLEITWYENT